MPATTTFHQQLIDAMPRLRAYALFLTRDRSSADDLLQEAAVRALSAQAQFTPGTNFNAWMHCIMRNQYISGLRRAHRSATSIDDVPEHLVARSPSQENTVLLGEVSRAMNRMSRGHREALGLISGGLCYEEAAKHLGCSIGTIKSRVWRARAQLENMMAMSNGPA